MEKAGIFPLRLQNTYFQKIVEKYPDIQPAFIVYTTDRIADITMIRAHYISQKDSRKIFSLEHRSDAFQWLLDCRQKFGN